MGELTPIHLIYGAHDLQDASSLNRLEERARKALNDASRPVVIFIEASDVLTSEAGATRGFILQGLNFYQARCIVDYIANFAEFPNNQQLTNYIRVFRRKLDPFCRREYDILHSLSLDYPRRVIPLLENVMDGTNAKKHYALQRRFGKKYREGQKYLIYKNSPTSGVSRLRESIDVYTEFNRGREDRIIEDLQVEATEVTEYSPASSLIIGYLGITHTRVGIELRKKGLEVTREFPEFPLNHDYTFYFPALPAILRQGLFFPDMPLSEDLYLLFFVANCFENTTVETGLISEDERGLIGKNLSDFVKRNGNVWQQFKQIILQEGMTEAMDYLSDIAPVIPRS